MRDVSHVHARDASRIVYLSLLAACSRAWLVEQRRTCSFCSLRQAAKGKAGAAKSENRNESNCSGAARKDVSKDDTHNKARGIRTYASKCTLHTHTFMSGHARANMNTQDEKPAESQSLAKVVPKEGDKETEAEPAPPSAFDRLRLRCGRANKKKLSQKKVSSWFF